MKIRLLMMVLLCAGAIFSCKHEIINPPAGGGGTGGGGTGGGGTGSTVVCFEADILPIFKSGCAKSGCHDAASANKGYVFTTYANIVAKDIKPGNANDSKVYKVLIETDPNKRMPRPPQAPLSSSQIALIKKWIDEGANNTTNCGKTCDDTKFLYSADIRPILETNCINCHNSTFSNGGVDLSTYSGVRTVALNGRLSGAINHSPGFSPMPRNSPKLSACNISQIQKWISAGALNN